MKENRIRTRLANGSPAIGASLNINSPHLVELAGSLDFDWVFIDCEHGVMSEYGLRSPKTVLKIKASRAKETFETTATTLAGGTDAEQIVDLIPRLNSDLAKIRRQFELIEAMGVVEGFCEACKSYVK